MKLSMSKTIQIAILPESENMYPSLFALEDDGTIWVAPIKRDTQVSNLEWKLCSEIPSMETAQ